MAVTIYHNPRCSKSRQALALLEEKGAAVKVVRYLEEPPSANAIKALVKKLGLHSPREMMRVKEAPYRDLDLKSVDAATALVDAMAQNPILIERPIVVNGDKAVIARPPEKALDVL
ncbi:MAG: arsenate reductase (glutaredoxin) [Hyphococcus sp.]